MNAPSHISNIHSAATTKFAYQLHSVKIQAPQHNMPEIANAN